MGCCRSNPQAPESRAYCTFRMRFLHSLMASLSIAAIVNAGIHDALTHSLAGSEPVLEERGCSCGKCCWAGSFEWPKHEHCPTNTETLTDPDHCSNPPAVTPNGDGSWSKVYNADGSLVRMSDAPSALTVSISASLGNSASPAVSSHGVYFAAGGAAALVAYLVCIG